MRDLTCPTPSLQSHYKTFITETTWYRWKNQYGAMLANDAKKLKELEKENSRLKTIVADLTLDVSMLKEFG